MFSIQTLVILMVIVASLILAWLIEFKIKTDKQWWFWMLVTSVIGLFIAIFWFQ
jgi:uncharacterized membrane protein HdeD (DUF308 family)